MSQIPRPLGKIWILLVLVCVTLTNVYSQDKFDGKKYTVDKEDYDKIKTQVKAYRTAEIDLVNLNATLKSKHKKTEGYHFTLNIDGELLEFRIFENDVMPDDPKIKKVVNTYAGYINNNAENFVRLYMSDKRLAGKFKTNNGIYIITPFDDMNAGKKVKNVNKVVIYDENDDLSYTNSTISCGNYLKNPNPPKSTSNGRIAALTPMSNQVLRVAVETDCELWDRFNEANKTAQEANIRARIAEWFNLADKIYTDNFKLRLKVVEVRLDWRSKAAPYPYNNDGVLGTPLTQFRTYWNANRNSIQRDFALMFTGKGLVAYTGSPYAAFGEADIRTGCKAEKAYGLNTIWHKIENRILTNDNIARNICHEIGHSFGASDIPCLSTDSTKSIMCPMEGKGITFDNTNAQRIQNYLNSADCTTGNYQLGVTETATFTNSIVLKYDGGTILNTPIFINNNPHRLTISNNDITLLNTWATTFNATSPNVYFWYKNGTEARFEARSTPSFNINVYA